MWTYPGGLATTTLWIKFGRNKNLEKALDGLRCILETRDGARVGLSWEGVIEATRRPISRWDVHRWMLLTFVVFKRLCFSRKPIGWRALYQQPTRIRQRTGTATAVYGCFRRFHSQGRGSQAQRVKLHGVNVLVHARPSVVLPSGSCPYLSFIFHGDHANWVPLDSYSPTRSRHASKLRCNTIGAIPSALQLAWRRLSRCDVVQTRLMLNWMLCWLAGWLNSAVNWIDACSE